MKGGRDGENEGKGTRYSETAGASSAKQLTLMPANAARHAIDQFSLQNLILCSNFFQARRQSDRATEPCVGGEGKKGRGERVRRTKEYSNIHSRIFMISHARIAFFPLKFNRILHVLEMCFVS